MVNKVKKKPIFLLICIFILLFSYLLQEKNNALKNNNNKDIKDIVPNSSNVDSWYRTWGGVNNDGAKAIALDLSGNIYIAGYTNSYGGIDMALVKFDSSGVLQWNVTWGGGSIDEAYAIALDSLDNIYLAGRTNSYGVGWMDLCLVKFDNSGIFQWYRTWGGYMDEVAYEIALDSSDNIYLAGQTNAPGWADFVLLKYDNSGNYQWNRTWSGSGATANAIALDPSDNVYLAGYTSSNGAGEIDSCLVKYDSSGVFQWYRTWGGSDGDAPKAITLDSSNNIYLAGYTFSYGAGGKDMSLVKYDSSGVFQWYRTWGGSGFDGANAIALDSSDNVYLAGFGKGTRDMVLVKYNSSGDYQWYRTWGGSSYENAYAIALDSSDNIYLAGCTYSFGAGNEDMVLVKNPEASEASKSPSIQSYNLFILISITCVISVILVMSRKLRHKK